jgi:regulator of sigma E protease
MYDILLVVFAVIFVLGVAINIHEFGHFIVAKMFGMRVDAYSFFGLGPRVWGFKIGHTDYRISAIPLGAYVKLYGDEATSSLEGGSSEERVETFLDERNIGEHDPNKKPTFKPVLDSELYELRPRWQKFLVMIGGPFMNLVLAFAIPFIGGLAFGIPSMPAPIVGNIQSGSAAEVAQLKVGDRVVQFDGVENPTWRRINIDAAISPEKEIPLVVERDGKRLPLTIKPTKAVQNGNAVGVLGFESEGKAEAVTVGKIEEGMPAASSGLQVGDWVVSVNGIPVKNRGQMVAIVGEVKDQPLNLVVDRNGERKEITTTTKLDDKGIYRIGIAFGKLAVDLEPIGVGQAVTFAWDSNVEIIRATGKVFGQLFSGQRSVKDAGVAGPIGIVQIIAQMVRDAGFAGLFPILMVISLNLGIFNLLPIPMLDGGQIAFLGIDKFLSWFGKELSMAVKEKIQLTGLGIILLLMVAVMYLDIARIIG